MALTIRLRQQGRTNRKFYRLVVAEKRSPRDGKYLESIGWYNPFESEDEKNLSVDSEKAQHWLENGAELTPKAEALIKRGAPAVIKAYKERLQAKRIKEATKKKAKA